MSSEGGRLQDFDRFLEHELTGRLGRLTGPTPLPSQAAFRRGGRVKSLAASAAAALATVALIVGGGSVVAVATTGSANPSVWGRTASSAAATCRADLAQGEHGIGHCVSAIAKTHGQQERAINALPQVMPATLVTPPPTTTPAAIAPATVAPTAPSKQTRPPSSLPTPGINAPGQSKKSAADSAGRPSPVPDHTK